MRCVLVLQGVMLAGDARIELREDTIRILAIDPDMTIVVRFEHV